MCNLRTQVNCGNSEMQDGFAGFGSWHDLSKVFGGGVAVRKTMEMWCRTHGVAMWLVYLVIYWCGIAMWLEVMSVRG